MKTMRTIVAALLFISLWVTCVCADVVLDAVKIRGRLLVGVRDTRERLSFRDAQGRLTGLEIDLANAIGERLGVPVEFVIFHDFAGIRAAWEGEGFSSYDIAISTITITGDRAERADFSAPYFTSGSAVMVLASSPFRDPDDLAKLRIGVIEGATPQQIVRERYPKAASILCRDYEDLLKELRNGSVDGILADLIQLKILAVKDSSLRVLVKKILMLEDFGVVMPKGSIDLKTIVDSVVEKDKDLLYRKWFK